MTDHSIVRDHWERPFVSQDGGPLQYVKGRKTPVNAEPYTRISTLAGALDSSKGLIDWTAAHAMIGLVKNDSLYAQVAHLASAYSKPWYVPEGKKPLKDLVRRAKEAGGTDDAAGMGTAFHGICEVIDNGVVPEFIPRSMKPWVEVRMEAMEAADFEPVLVEPFIINDTLKVAGNPDRYVRHRATGIVYAADDKTGTDEPEYPMKATIQVAIASRGQLYDQPTGKRTPIECSQERGVLIHTPIKTDVPKCDLYWLDLTVGWELAELAAIVRDKSKLKRLERIR